MIIDAHAHVGPWFFAMDTASAEVNEELCDRYGIDLQLVSGTEAVLYDPAPGNAAVARVLTDHPRLYGYITIDPRDPRATETELDRHLPGGRFVGVKVHEHYSATPLADPAMLDAMRLVADAGIPLLAHTWGESVLDLARACERVPGLRVLAGHMGGPSWRLAPQAVAMTDRLYLEPCYSVAERGRIAWIMERVPADRLVFGTDSTLIDPSVALGAIAAAGLDRDTLDRVLWRTAAELFDLPVGTPPGPINGG